jgi:hypothetical protein
MNENRFIGKVCKVYLSKEQTEIEEGECWYSYGIIKEVDIKERQLKNEIMEDRKFTLEPIDYIPDDIDYYHDGSEKGKYKKVFWIDKPKKYRQERKSPIIHEDKQVIKKK